MRPVATILSLVSGWLAMLLKNLRRFLGLDEVDVQAGKPTLIGLAASGGFLLLVAAWLFSVDTSSLIARSLIVGLVCFGMFNLVSVFVRRPGMARANQLALAGHLIALLSFYFFSTRFLSVIYTTDSMVGTYLGVAKTLQLQNPYLFSIKPLLDQLGFPPSLYTPRMDGTFEFHLNYPAMNFLSLLPFYFAGVHDLRDGVFFFHLLSIFVLFGLAPSRLKAAVIVPFMIAGPVIVSSWTDSVWAFFVLLSAISWTRNRKGSLLLIGLAGAVKQIALVITPFLLIRQWREAGQTGSKLSLVKSAALMAAGFLLPNLPFMFSSPGAWWAATVVPFLPGSPAQVPGGMGLSSIIIELGITVPSWFYIFTSLAAFSLLVFAYTVRFERLNKYVWAFPMILFLFYNRSFPNYIVFWAFPTIMELSRWKNLSLKIPLRLPKFVIPLVVRLGQVSSSLRGRLTPSVMVVLALTAVLAGASAAYVSTQASHGVQVQINSAFDPDNIGAATLLNVTLTNPGSTPISPVFFVKWNLLADIWNFSSSSRVLSAKSEQTYLIRATDALAAVPRGTTFRILVSDKFSQQLIAESALITSKLPATPVVNPLFKWWTLDTTVGKKIPFGWHLNAKNTDLSTSGIEPLGSNGLLARLNYTAKDTGPAQLALSQKLLFNSTNIRFLLNESLTTSPVDGVLFGASISDGTHQLYYVFSDTATTTSIATYLENTTITVPVARSSWTPFELKLLPVWTDQGWTVPSQVTITFFVRAATTGVYYASINQVELAASAAPPTS